MEFPWKMPPESLLASSLEGSVGVTSIFRVFMFPFFLQFLRRSVLDVFGPRFWDPAGTPYGVPAFVIKPVVFG